MKSLPRPLVSMVTKIRDNIRERKNDNPHRSFRPTHKYVKPQQAALPSIAYLNGQVFRAIAANKKLLFGIVLIYGLFSYAAVGLSSQSNYANFKEVIGSVSEGESTLVMDTLTIFGATLTGSFNTELSELQQFIASIVALLFWLVLIWTHRNITAEQKVTIRQALYNSTAPFISSLTVAAILLLQLVPGALGVLLITLISGQDIAANGAEAMAFGVAAILLLLISIYFTTSTLIGSVIVTLPNMYPLAALKLSRQLTLGRRFSVFIRLLSMIAVVLVVWTFVLLPIIYIDARFIIPYVPVVSIVVQLLAATTLLYTATYLYKLYRSML